MATPTPVDTSSFTAPQLAAFNKAAALGTGVPTYNSAAPASYGPNPAPVKSSGSSGSSSTPPVARYPTGYDSAAGVTNDVDSAENDYVTSTTPEDPNAVAARVSAEYAAQLAAIKTRYAALTSNQEVTNTSNAGKTRAVNAASGVLGQDFGNANDANTAAAGQQALATISAEEGNEEGAVYSGENTEINGQLDKEKTTNQSALQQKLTYLQGVATQAQAKVQSIAANTPLDTLDQTTYDTLYKQAGFDTPDEFNTYYEASRTAALQGAKLVGSDTVGYFIPTVGSDGTTTYKNVIPAKPTVINGSQYGNYVLGADGNVTQVSPGQQTKIITSGGRLWSVDLKTNAATPLTSASSGAGKTGWQQASIDQQLAVQAWITKNASSSGKDPSTYVSQVQSDPDAFLYALNQALDAGIYSPINVTGSTDPGSDSTDTSDSADNAYNDSGN